MVRLFFHRSPFAFLFHCVLSLFLSFSFGVGIGLTRAQRVVGVVFDFSARHWRLAADALRAGLRSLFGGTFETFLLYFNARVGNMLARLGGGAAPSERRPFFAPGSWRRCAST
jgi:hypothetical protein